MKTLYRPELHSGSKKMKALTICQPWAELIASGAKRVENRTWSTKYRGELAIHAGKSRAFLGDEDDGDYVFGAVIAVARLVEVVRLDEIAQKIDPAKGLAEQDDKYAWVFGHKYAEGPWCWVLEDVRRVEPVYCTGKQGLWEWTQ